MKFSLGAIALLLAAFLTGRSFAADPSGTWRWEHQDPAIQKKVKDVLKIKYENGKVSGTYQGGADLHEIQKAKVEGNQLFHSVAPVRGRMMVSMAWATPSASLAVVT